MNSAKAFARLDDKSRMSREVHVRFCERLGGRFLGSTRPCAESFFHSMKIEAIYGERFPTRHSIRQEVFEYIETFYNTIRQHSTLGYISPEKFEAAAVV